MVCDQLRKRVAKPSVDLAICGARLQRTDSARASSHLSMVGYRIKVLDGIEDRA